MKSLVVGLVLGLAVSSAIAETFVSKGVKLNYVTVGEGEAVVLLHGWMGDSTMWGKDAAENAKLSPLPGFKVIALDVRGHGKSDKPHDVGQYGAEMAEDVVRLLDHLKIQRAHLVGYSMGTFIAGKVAATHPDRVLSLIFGGQAPLLIGESGAREIEVFAKLVEEGNGLGPYLIEFAPGASKLTLESANALAKLTYSGKDVNALAAAGLSFGGLEVWATDLQKCRVPVLFLFGSLESDILKTRVAAWQKLLPGSQVTMVEGGNHVTTLAKPQFGKSLVEFLQKSARSNSRP